MGRKSKDNNEPSPNKGKKGKASFAFLNNRFDAINEITVKQHIALLILASVIAKILVVLVTTLFFHSFIDLFDIGVYLEHALMPLNGQYPYIGGDFQYPILIFIPMMIAVIPAVITQNAMVFVYTFQFLMMICDIVTILCVYLIGLKIWDEETSFHAGLLYAAAFSAAYFVITKYDAFPTCLLMLAVLFTLYRHEVKGYASSIFGFFVKVFPILALPLFVLYNAKDTSLRQEIITAAKVAIPISGVLFVPLFILNAETLKIYIPVRSELGYYSNTLTFTTYSWIHDVLHIGISIDVVSACMYTFMGIGILTLLVIAYKIPKKNPKLLIKLLLCAIILTIVCAKVRSPQYIVWFSPLICILAIDDIKKVISLFILQTLAYIEFPVMFGAFYTALQYTSPVLSSGWMLTLIMFTLEYFVMFICIWLVVSPREIFRKLQKSGRTLEN